MAIVKLGPIVSDIRGALGGTVFSRSRTGPFVRTWAKPIHAPTNIRSDYKSAMSQCFSRWRDIVTPDERAAWNSLADATTFTNALGSSYHLSGWNLYFRTNGLLFYYALEPVDTAPANAVATHHNIDFVLNGPPWGINFHLHDEWPETTRIFIWGAYGRPLTQYTNYGPYVNEWQGTPAIYGYDWIDPMGWEYNETNAVFTRDRAIDSDGAVSAAYFTRTVYTGI